MERADRKNPNCQAVYRSVGGVCSVLVAVVRMGACRSMSPGRWSWIPLPVRQWRGHSEV